jgi:hypothetical protein
LVILDWTFRAVIVTPSEEQTLPTILLRWCKRAEGLQSGAPRT